MEQQAPALNKSQAVALAEFLRTSLELDLRDLEALNTLLSEERSALEQTEIASLQAIAGRKSDLVSELDRRAKQRQTQLQANRLPSQGSQDWLKTIEHIESKSGLKLWALWRDVEAALKNCNTLLQINEKIISAMHHSASRFIDELHEKSGAQKAGTYGAKGEIGSRSSRSQPLVSA